MKVSVNQSLCAGTGLCVETCPEVFELNEEGLSTVRVDKVSPDLERACREAVENCPTNAIKIEE